MVSYELLLIAIMEQAGMMQWAKEDDRPREDLVPYIHIAAQAWCATKTATTEMDVVLGEVFARLLRFCVETARPPRRDTPDVKALIEEGRALMRAARDAGEGAGNDNGVGL